MLPVSVSPANVGDAAVCMSCGRVRVSDPVAGPVPALIYIWFRVLESSVTPVYHR